MHRNQNLLMLGPECLCDKPGVLRFVVSRLTKNDGEGVGPYSTPLQQGDEAAGVDSAGKKNPDRNIAYHLHLDRFGESGVNLSLHPFLIGIRDSRRAPALGN